MNYKKTKWFFYTILIGLIPFYSRVIVFLTIKDKNYGFLFNEVDFIVLGLISQVSNINELETTRSFDKSWKTIYNATAIIFISFFLVLFTISLLQSTLNQMMNITNMKVIAIGLGLVSVAISYSIYDRMLKFKLGKSENE